MTIAVDMGRKATKTNKSNIFRSDIECMRSKIKDAIYANKNGIGNLDFDFEIVSFLF